MFESIQLFFASLVDVFIDFADKRGGGKPSHVSKTFQKAEDTSTKLVLHKSMFADILDCVTRSVIHK